MKSRILISVLAVLFFIPCKSQSLVGLSKDDVKYTVKNEYKKFSVDKSIVKQQFNYLKFVNRDRSKTLIVYFSDKNISLSSKMICDYSEKDLMISELNEKYKKTGDKNWQYKSEGITYNIEVEEMDWYFTIRERKSKS